mmetsp:Transcript_21292/g.23790  ORF Transcript_21292/g.23790 Transcript_21292/m.23790 type:complete len:126 (+) Transcript_21292:77-454(+)
MESTMMTNILQNISTLASRAQRPSIYDELYIAIEQLEASIGDESYDASSPPPSRDKMSLSLTAIPERVCIRSRVTTRRREYRENFIRQRAATHKLQKRTSSLALPTRYTGTPGNMKRRNSTTNWH